MLKNIFFLFSYMFNTKDDHFSQNIKPYFIEKEN